MSYSKDHFGRDIFDLEYADLVNYFKVSNDETDRIEYKSYVIHSSDTGGHKEKEKSVIKSVCGFLNSEGGLLIWGAPEGQKDLTDAAKTVFHGALTPFTENYDKDSFVRKVTDSITPSPRAIRFKQLDDGGGKYVYVIEVEKSEYSPHQYSNNYFMRIDGQTKIAPHHYIEALFKKISFPKLSSNFYISSPTVQYHATLENKLELVFTVNFAISNLSKMHNEHDIDCQLSISEGYFRGDKISKRYLHTTPLKTYSPLKSILYYGAPVKESEVATEFDVKYKNEYDFLFTLTFGGKSSPLMISKYAITISIDIHGNCTVNEDWNQENKYFYEL